MPINSTSDGNTVKMTITGRFDFSVHKEFRDAYSNTPAGSGTIFVIDMTQTEYVDSSALGMLLLLREHAGSEQANVTIKGCQNYVKEILIMSNFNKLFTIS